MVNDKINSFVNNVCYRFTACTHLHPFFWQGLERDVDSHHQHQNISDFGLAFLTKFPYPTIAEQIHQIHAFSDYFGSLD